MDHEKALPPSARKIREARLWGLLPQSRSFTAACSLFAFLTVGFFVTTQTHKTLLRLFQLGLSPTAASLDAQHISALAMSMLLLAMAVLWPFLASGFFVALIFGWLQTGFNIAGGALGTERRTARGFQHWFSGFSAQKLVELTKTLFELLLVTGIAAWMIFQALPALYLFASPEEIGPTFARVMETIFMRLAAGLLALGALDFLYRRWKFLQGQKRSYREARREQKDEEMSPEVKRALRSLRLSQVPPSKTELDVLIVDDYGQAVQLRFDTHRSDATPWIVDHLARGAQVSVNPALPRIGHASLAQRLRSVRTGEIIPSDTYTEVAAIYRQLLEQ